MEPSIPSRPVRHSDHPDGPAFCKWSSEGAGLLQMIIWRIRTMRIIIRRDRPLANDHLEGSSSKRRNWDSSSWMKIASFLCKIRNSTFLYVKVAEDLKHLCFFL